MAQTVGCTDFNQDCSFRITAAEGNEDAMVTATTAHAMKQHPDLAPSETEFRESIRSSIRSIMSQANMSQDDIAEMLT